MKLRPPYLPLSLFILSLSLAATREARAEDLAPPPPPPTSNLELSPYEQETLRLGLAKFEEVVEPNAEGKPIERVDIVSLDVFEDRDVMPKAAEERPWAKKTLTTSRNIANSIHWTSRDFTIRREMLFSPGDPYKQILAEETARNLRSLSQLSAVVIVPVKSKTSPDKVRVLVITKDVWSLRLNWNLAFGNGKISQLTFQPQERNVFGLHHTASTLFDLLPLSYTLGAGYSVPRFGTTRIGAAASASLVMNRASGKPEGSGLSASVDSRSSPHRPSGRGPRRRPTRTPSPVVTSTGSLAGSTPRPRGDR